MVRHIGIAWGHEETTRSPRASRGSRADGVQVGREVRFDRHQREAGDVRLQVRCDQGGAGDPGAELMRFEDDAEAVSFGYERRNLLGKQPVAALLFLAGTLGARSAVPLSPKSRENGLPRAIV